MWKLTRKVVALCALATIATACSAHDKYLGTWEGIHNGRQVTISRHVKGGPGQMPASDPFGETIVFDISGCGPILTGGVNGNEDLIVTYGPFSESPPIHYDGSSGHLKGWLCGAGEDEWKKR